MQAQPNTPLGKHPRRETCRARCFLKKNIVGTTGDTNDATGDQRCYWMQARPMTAGESVPSFVSVSRQPVITYTVPLCGDGHTATVCPQTLLFKGSDTSRPLWHERVAWVPRGAQRRPSPTHVAHNGIRSYIGFRATPTADRARRKPPTTPSKTRLDFLRRPAPAETDASRPQRHRSIWVGIRTRPTPAEDDASLPDRHQTLVWVSRGAAYNGARN